MLLLDNCDDGDDDGIVPVMVDDPFLLPLAPALLFVLLLLTLLLLLLLLLWFLYVSSLIILLRANEVWLIMISLDDVLYLYYFGCFDSSMEGRTSRYNPPALFFTLIRSEKKWINIKN